MNTLDRNSPVPLYYQLKTILLERIHNNEWTEGEMFPGEQELQEDYELSRTTVRQTLSELVNEGYLVRHRGRGTFVAKPKVTYNPTASLEMTEYMRKQGIQLGWRLLKSEWTTADAAVASMLHLTEGAPVWAVRRLRLVGEETIGYHCAYVPKRYAPHLNMNALEEGDSLDYLKGLPQMANPRIERTLEARLSGELETELLGMASGAPMLYMERVVYSAEGEPLEFLQAAFHGDRFRYRISL